ncbi:SCP2 sterol-binding domain-containing protein [Marinomonas sp. C2222]|uniref:SCP2 sterol-binding domain-containing protein n=1 Tax=Marinomonas sargassi TaxID=2984494 RepID=A0ABT2YRW1_9GAMM|nr:SCP2 sterol-binding domain-containing protein [Marinomonas sargassi]MCV2402628.1 SCP2 sterol-binding domain-containing protein [Marinomonas sargassi]
MSDAKALFKAMVNRFDSNEAKSMDAVFQFELDDSNNYFLLVQNSTCEIGYGEHDDPTVTLNMDFNTLKRIVEGDLDGMFAFMQGKIRADGDIMLATKLTQIFPV